MSFVDWIYSEEVESLKKIFLSKMRRYGIRSAILTTMGFWRANLKTKEAVKQLHCVARKDQLEKENRANVIVERIISEDLELFYTNL